MHNGLTKEDSSALKGVAICMLLFLHLFKAGRYEKFNISFGPFSDGFIQVIVLMCGMCVSIFAFISGYGLLQSIRGTLSKPWDQKTVIVWEAKRLIKTLSGFWFVYVVAIIVTSLINQLPYKTYFKGNTILSGILYMLLDFTALRRFFSTPTLCTTWWYMGAALFFVLLVPLVYNFAKKYGYLLLVAMLVILPHLFRFTFLGPTNPYVFVIAFVLGMCFSEYDLFGRIEEALPEKKALSYVLRWIIFGVCVCIIALYFHDMDRGEVWELSFGILPVVFILFLRFCIIRVPVLHQIFDFLGKHSMMIFLTHTFLRNMYLHKFIYTRGNFVQVYLTLFVLSLALALLLDFIKQKSGYDRLIGKLSDRLVAGLEQNAMIGKKEE